MLPDLKTEQSSILHENIALVVMIQMLFLSRQSWRNLSTRVRYVARRTYVPGRFMVT